MLYQKTIRKFIALAMLVVFAFSITPQKSIHDLVAKHIDPTSCSVHKDLPIEQIEKAELHCTFDFQVATTPFVAYDFSVILQPPFVAVALLFCAFNCNTAKHNIIIIKGIRFILFI